MTGARSREPVRGGGSSVLMSAPPSMMTRMASLAIPAEPTVKDMGCREVYRATDTKLNRQVALMVTSPRERI